LKLKIKKNYLACQLLLLAQDITSNIKMGCRKPKKKKKSKVKITNYKPCKTKQKIKTKHKTNAKHKPIKKIIKI
jgi:hypothetical protein